LALRQAQVAVSPERIHCFIITGFLGSGKTTLLRRLLADPNSADSLVIVNELGEVGLDHDMIAFSTDRTVLLPGGCLCCSIREDIETTLRQIFEDLDAGRIPPFRRIFIEMSGIADPHPLLCTLHVNPYAASRLESPRVFTVVDGVLGRSTLASAPEAARQAAAADSIIISKPDLAMFDDLGGALRQINPWAPIYHFDLLRQPLADLLTLFDCVAESPRREIECELSAPDAHAHGVHSFALSLDESLNWTAFGTWMTMLLHRHGADILRVKGILAIEGNPGPVLFHCAQHLVHPPEHLANWNDHQRRSRLVFIVRNLDPALIEQSFGTFMAISDGAASDFRQDSYLAASAGATVAGRPIRRPSAPRWIKG
jgi:G3E family GTPase